MNSTSLQRLLQTVQLPTLDEIRYEQARRSAVEFARLATGFDLDPWQERVLLWDGRKIVLNCARQSGKSTIAGLLALYLTSTQNNHLILIVSPSERQSGELFRKIRGFLRELPTEMIPKIMVDNVLSCEFENGSRIVALPGTEKTIRSFSGVDLLIEDEAARVPDELHYAVRPMLAVSNGRHMLLSTPFGKTGHFYDALNSPDWDIVTVPATDNPRISQEFLNQERRALGEWWFNQEYMCIPMEDIDSVFSMDHIRAAISQDIKPLFEVSR